MGRPRRLRRNPEGGTLGRPLPPRMDPWRPPAAHSLPALGKPSMARDSLPQASAHLPPIGDTGRLVNNRNGLAADALDVQEQGRHA